MYVVRPSRATSSSRRRSTAQNAERSFRRSAAKSICRTMRISKATLYRYLAQQRRRGSLRDWTPHCLRGSTGIGAIDDVRVSSKLDSLALFSAPLPLDRPAPPSTLRLVTRMLGLGFQTTESHLRSQKARYDHVFHIDVDPTLRIHFQGPTNRAELPPGRVQETPQEFTVHGTARGSPVAQLHHHQPGLARRHGQRACGGEQSRRGGRVLLYREQCGSDTPSSTATGG